MTSFRDLHAPGRLLILPNAWDAGSARMIESCGAEAIATTSAGVAWSHGYPDGNALPVAVLRTAVAEIAQAIEVPLTVDIEAGYAKEPKAVGELVRALVDVGAVGINIEDGQDPPELLCTKIAAAKSAALAANVDLFVNARTDTILQRLVPKEAILDELLARARAYAQAGCDGIFVPGLARPDVIGLVAKAIDPLPLNVMAFERMPTADDLRALGVRRLSAGAALASAMLAKTRRLATAFLAEGSFQVFDEGLPYPMANELFAGQVRKRRAAERPLN